MTKNITICKTLFVKPPPPLVDSEKPKNEEESQLHTCVTIDSTHKVTEHYMLQEKLGM